jgi:coproporphyrinogen III oxidase-like Fe-S oxidoreductase
LVLGKDNLVKIMDKILSLFNTEFLEEWSIELNPNPYEEVLDFVKFVNKKYRNLFRLRYSFGIQSLDDQVLKNA